MISAAKLCIALSPCCNCSRAHRRVPAAAAMLCKKRTCYGEAAPCGHQGQCNSRCRQAIAHYSAVTPSSHRRLQAHTKPPPCLEMQGKSAQLFDGGDTEREPVDLELTVNTEYARRLQHNKQREELHRLQERHPEIAARAAVRATNVQVSDSDEESSEEDEDDGYISSKVEKQIFETMSKIRNRDSSIYDSNKHFFAEPTEDNKSDRAGKSRKKSKPNKPMLLKDVIAQQALEHGAEAAESDEEDNEQPADPTYVQEQQDLKRSFLQAVEAEESQAGDDELGGGVLRKRQRVSAQEQQSDADAADLQQSLDKYFGTDGPLNEDDKFLRHYVLNKGWVDADTEGVPAYEEIVGAHDDEDEAYDEQADQFEAAYNFRFEEEGGRQMVTHPRVMEHVVRKPDERRKRKRAEKAERKAAEQTTQQQEVKRLKNLKSQEIQDRLQKIKDIAGASGQDNAAFDALMKGDFDPDEYDKHMEAAFGDDYYQGEEDDPGQILDDELQQQLNEMASYDSDADEQPREENSSGDEAAENNAQANAAELAAQRNAVSKLLGEYNKLDYEDDIGGLKTRFHYRNVGKEDYGLSTDEILRLNDKELNQLVGLKRLAPYREDRGKFRPNYAKMKELKVAEEDRQANWQQKQQRRQQHKQQQRAKAKQEKISAPSAAAAELPAADMQSADAKAQRMKSFEKLSLKRSKADGSHAVTKKPKPSSAEHTDAVADGLSKAARKNLRRAEKRAAKRGQTA